MREVLDVSNKMTLENEYFRKHNRWKCNWNSVWRAEDAFKQDLERSAFGFKESSKWTLSYSEARYLFVRGREKE
jgi:hypothetical protein